MEKNKAAVELGRLGGLARNSHLTKKELQKLPERRQKQDGVKEIIGLYIFHLIYLPLNFFPQRSHHQPFHSPIYKPSR